MPSHPIPLAQTATARGWAKTIGTSAKDAQVINGVIEVSVNQAMGTKTVSVSKRAGSAVRSSTPTDSSLIALKHSSSRFEKLYVGGSSLSLYEDDTDVGTLTATLSPATNYQLADTVINDVGVVGFVTSDNVGWVLYEDAISDNFPTFGASLTSGQATAVNIASTTGIYEGQLWAGSGVPASTRVSDVLNSSMVLLSQAATQSGTKTITKEAVSKILDSNFPSDATNMETMDGWFFVGTGTGIRNSDINDPFTWDTDQDIPADDSGDDVNLIFRNGDYICASGEGGTIQFFYNAGNAVGSILSAATNLNVRGISCLCRPFQHASGLYFIGQEAIDSLLTRGLYRLNGVNTIEPVSDDVMNSIITDLSLTMVSPVTNGNKSLLAVHSSAAATFPVYDPIIDEFTFFSLSAALTSGNRVVFTRSGTSTALDWKTDNTWTDSAAAYTLTIQSEIQDMAGGLDTTDTWIDLLADVESTGTTSLDVTDDDYASWVNKGSFDMTKVRKRINAAGLHNLRAYRITHSANTGFRGQLMRVTHVPSTL